MVAAIPLESATTRVHRWLAVQRPGSLVISDWVIAEVSSALSLKIRTGVLDPMERTSALAAFNSQIARSLTVLPVAGAHFLAAARYADRHELNVRSGDALHLAIAAAHGASLITLDRRLHSAGLALGVALETV